ncbi:hypothetical protein AC578_10749 [Pseudocercospora eumusae]|uniref:Uncharacterized protein n=1 Tax=Pseudocercospora eumusae TaxID=321146 RepID=A0A139H4N4_9PEZI|nr:hypothetical protein AC578_10749 [Pseudocercospora eumusae]
MKRFRTYCRSVWRKTWRRTRDCYYLLPVIFLHLWWFWSYIWTLQYLLEFLTARQIPYNACKKQDLKYCLQDELDFGPKKRSRLLDTVEANIFFVLLTSQLVITIGEQITMVLGRSGPWTFIIVEAMKIIELLVWYAMQLRLVDQSERRLQDLDGLAARCPEYWRSRTADGLYPSLVSSILMAFFVFLFWQIVVTPLLCSLTPTTDRYTFPCIWRAFGLDSPVILHPSHAPVS